MRIAWFDGQLDLDPERLIFIDETAASTKMAWLPTTSMARRESGRGKWKPHPVL
ncbi:hypothetical protein [Phyllobacterium brassicacearum]|uniref:hypothetical protein n=1 Tax=Phyllobacterium brassicacearum TaxID=314235 RepID=UPI001415285A|nr:hypothetical protein [Phyllobacterium brassicacearum]